MAGIQRILCPIDFSEPSRHALEHAVASASSYGARITVCHVYRELPIADEAAVVPPIEPQTVVEQVRRFCGSVIVGGSPEIVVAEGNPAKEIARLAGEMPADLLVMGTHGRGGFERCGARIGAPPRTSGCTVPRAYGAGPVTRFRPCRAA